VAATAILLAGGVAFAQSTDTGRLTAQGGWANGAVYDGQSMSLANAIKAVEQQTGGKVLEIRFENRNGRGVYNAVVSANGALTHARVDAKSDEILKFEGSTPDWMLNWQARADVRSLNKTTVPLPKAVQTAEQFGVGTAIDASLAKPLTPENAVLAYNVEVVRDGHPVRVAVDANTDQVIADPNMLETWAPE
jgi:uncharacterized membrane protein YkoI